MASEGHVKIFDTTLRDGQQCPGAGMSLEHNLEYAALASEVKLDVVEAGFPSASKLDFEIVNRIAQMYGSASDAPTVAGLCQLRDEQIDITIESLEPARAAGRARLHTYVPVAPELMLASLGDKADKSQITRNVANFVARAVAAGLEVEFSPEGYSRMAENFDFVSDLIRAAVEAGATTINCPDTIGGACEAEGEEYFVAKLRRHSEIIRAEYPDKEIVWSAHCHNDFGLAVANSVNAVFDGPCRQIEGCFNGIGERAGNVALESVIMVLRTFGEKACPETPFFTSVDVSKLQQICDFVGTHMLKRQPHWPVCGDNAARHSSGGHTNAVLSNPLAYQPFDPREIGKEITFLFGPLSGGNHAKSIIEGAGYRCDNSEKAKIAQFIKDVYKDRRKGITDDELLKGYFLYRSPIKATKFDYGRSANKSSFVIEGSFFDREGVIEESTEGNNSALAALKMASDRYIKTRIQSHRSESGSAGFDALSISRIAIVDEDEGFFEGEGADQDIEISAMKAFIDAVNKAHIERNFRNRADR